MNTFCSEWLIACFSSEKDTDSPTFRIQLMFYIKDMEKSSILFLCVNETYTKRWNIFPPKYVDN